MAIGDLVSVECFRGPVRYLHYGIDVGDGTVVHLATDADGRGMSVQRVTLDAFRKGSEISVEQVDRSLPSDLVVERALAAVGTKGYHLVMGNCEHFAREIKTGKGESHQVDWMVGSVVRSAFSGLASTSSRSVIAGSLAVVSSSRFLLAIGSLVPTVVSETARHSVYFAARRMKLNHQESEQISRSAGHAASALGGFVVGGPIGSAGALAISVASDRVTDKIKQQLSDQKESLS